MFRKIKSRDRKAAAGRLKIDLEGLRFDLTTADVMADLNYGVDPDATDPSRARGSSRPVGSAA